MRMAPASNRRRLRCVPLQKMVLSTGHLMGIPSNIEPLAGLYAFAPQVVYGLLVRVKSTGRLAEWSGGVLVGLDQRKAAAALDWMEKLDADGFAWNREPSDDDVTDLDDDPELVAATKAIAAEQATPEYQAAVAAELAKMCQEWRAKADIPAHRAATMLGIPRRTYESIEQGRGFRYPLLLTLAIKAFE